MEKSANQKWKESGTDLSFKEWLNSEQEKGNLEKEEFEASVKEGATQIFGIDRRWFIGGVVLATGFLLYRHLKKKK